MLLERRGRGNGRGGSNRDPPGPVSFSLEQGYRRGARTPLAASQQTERTMTGLNLSARRTGLAAALAGLVVLVCPAEAQRMVPESAASMQQSFAPVVKRAAPAVVNVYVRHRVEQMVSPFFDDPFFGRLFGERFGIPRERIQNSLGSGVLVGTDGVVVTNNHVIQSSGEAEITVALSDGREFPAKIILKDERSDLAVLRLEADGVQFPSI